MRLVTVRKARFVQRRDMVYDKERKIVRSEDIIWEAELFCIGTSAAERLFIVMTLVAEEPLAKPRDNFLALPYIKHTLTLCFLP